MLYLTEVRKKETKGIRIGKCTEKNRNLRKTTSETEKLHLKQEKNDLLLALWGQKFLENHTRNWPEKKMYKENDL